MKKKILLTTIMISLLLSGCGEAAPTNTTLQDEQPKLAAANNPKELEKSVLFATRSVSKEIKNSYGILIKFDLVLPVLTGTYSGIETINKYYEGKEKEYIAQKDSDYLNSDGNKATDFYYYLTAKYHLETKIGDVISIVGDGDSYTGGVSNPEIIGDVFDLNSGKKLGLDDIFKISQKEYLKIIIDRVSQKIQQDIENAKPGTGSGYNFDSPSSTEGKEEISKYDVHNFYLTKNALVVYYPKYALAVGAAGPQKFEIPFDSISDVLAIDVKTVPGTN